MVTSTGLYNSVAAPSILMPTTETLASSNNSIPSGVSTTSKWGSAVIVNVRSSSAENLASSPPQLSKRWQAILDRLKGDPKAITQVETRLAEAIKAYKTITDMRAQLFSTTKVSKLRRSQVGEDIKRIKMMMNFIASSPPSSNRAGHMKALVDQLKKLAKEFEDDQSGREAISQLPEFDGAAAVEKTLDIMDAGAKTQNAVVPTKAADGTASADQPPTDPVASQAITTEGDTTSKSNDTQTPDPSNNLYGEVVKMQDASDQTSTLKQQWVALANDGADESATILKDIKLLLKLAVQFVKQEEAAKKWVAR